MLDMLIKGGQVVTPSGVGNWDVGVQGEQIVAVALPGVLSEEGATVIDATGRIVVPGGVEAHAHAAANVQPGARETVPGTPNAGPAVHSLGAIWGGTTTVVDFAPVPSEGDLAAGIHDFMNVWQGNAYTDYTTHCIYREGNSPDSIARFHELVEAGVSQRQDIHHQHPPARRRGHQPDPIGQDRHRPPRRSDGADAPTRRRACRPRRGRRTGDVQLPDGPAAWPVGLAQRPPDPLQDRRGPGLPPRGAAGPAHRRRHVLRPRHCQRRQGRDLRGPGQRHAGVWRGADPRPVLRGGAIQGIRRDEIPHLPVAEVH